MRREKTAITPDAVINWRIKIAKRDDGEQWDQRGAKSSVQFAALVEKG